MFKKLLAAVGVGGAEVETELYQPGVQPGGTIEGVIRLRGGEVQQEIPVLSVELITRVEHEGGEEEVETMRGFHSVDVARDVQLPPEKVVETGFALPVPLETPITHFRDRAMPGALVSVRTKLDISGAVDATDTDPVGIGALPAQHVLLDAIEQLGFRLHKADVEAGRLGNTRQRLPFFQEIEFLGSPRYPSINQLEVSFVADEQGMDVVLEADKKAGLLSGGGDQINLLRVEHASLHQVDWSQELDGLLQRMSSRR